MAGEAVVGQNVRLPAGLYDRLDRYVKRSGNTKSPVTKRSIIISGLEHELDALEATCEGK